MKIGRVNFLLLLFFIFSTIIVFRLVFLQIIGYQYWRALAQGQQKSFVFLQEERGEIFFQGGEKLATNQEVNLLYASPLEIKDIEKTAEELSLILNLEKDIILEKLKKNSYYEVIKKKLSSEEVEKLKQLKLNGIYLSKEKIRYYPFETMACHALGFVGGDGNGQYGIEGFYNDILKGEDKVLEKEIGPGGFLEKNFKIPEKGANLILTLDYNIQFFAEKLLEKAKENLNIEEGEIIVLDPNSGKIFALANFPVFNPNEYSKIENLEIFQNSSIQKVFEPGSVFKPITMAAALDVGKITPQTSYVDKGFVEVSGHKISNYASRVWGEKTMTEVLEKSINTGAIFAQQQIGKEVFLDYLNRFGIFQATGIDLQGENFSENKEFKKGYEVNFATASFGQGIEMTSIQLARAISAIANGGKLIRPYIVDKIVKNDKIVETKTEVQNPAVISKNTASQLTLMLISVIEKGYGKEAKIPGYYIAGKTGTAQVPFTSLKINKRGYSDKTIQSFIGFAPAFDPKFLILVKLYNPQAKTAEYSATPIFKELAKYIIDLWEIPPDYE